MTTGNKEKTRKLIAAAVASAAIIISGTLAWSVNSQTALNEVAGVINVGGRLHDDFNGTNKDIYVENFTDPLDGGQPIFARIRLDEYMEVGKEAGDAENMDRDAVPVVAGTDINDVSTWTTHIPAEVCERCTASGTCVIHNHWAWEMGGETVFMPTFNKDKDSVAADINGTYHGNSKRDKIYYDDYETYAEGQPLTSTAKYDNDVDTLDDGDSKDVNETHYGKRTAKGTVITMQQWIAEGKKAGNYWVYDTDGWAYWANAILPGEASGLLLSGIEMVRNPGEKCYYGINVIAQFATSGDWGPLSEEGAGGAPSREGLEVLNTAAAAVPALTILTEEQIAILQPGDQCSFHATIKESGTDAEPTDAVSWSITDGEGKPLTASSIDEKGTLTIGKEETSPVIIVRAASREYAGIAARVSLRVVQEMEVQISEPEGGNTVGPGDSLQLELKAVEDPLEEFDTAEQIWTVTYEDGTTPVNGTFVDSTGLLTVSETEAVGTVLKLKASVTGAGGTASADCTVTIKREK